LGIGSIVTSRYFYNSRSYRTA